MAAAASKPNMPLNMQQPRPQADNLALDDEETSFLRDMLAESQDTLGPAAAPVQAKATPQPSTKQLPPALIPKRLQPNSSHGSSSATPEPTSQSVPSSCMGPFALSHGYQLHPHASQHTSSIRAPRTITVSPAQTRAVSRRSPSPGRQQTRPKSSLPALGTTNSTQSAPQQPQAVGASPHSSLVRLAPSSGPTSATIRAASPPQQQNYDCVDAKRFATMTISRLAKLKPPLSLGDRESPDDEALPPQQKRSPSASSTPHSSHSSHSPDHPGSAGAASASSSRAKSVLQDIGVMEEMLESVVQEHGAGSMEVCTVAEHLCRKYNTTAMKLMDGEAHDQALQLLQKAQVLTEPGGAFDQQPAVLKCLQAVTLNNLGCYYKARTDPQTALQYLRKAADAEASAPAGAAENPAGTLLNLSAVLSSLGQHEEALRQAHTALSQVMAQMRMTTEEVDSFVNGSCRGDDNVVQQMQQMPPSKASILSMCFYNQAVELEHLGRWQLCLQAYALAAGLATKILGRGSNLGMRFTASFEAFSLKLKHMERSRRRFGDRNGYKYSPQPTRPATAPPTSLKFSSGASAHKFRPSSVRSSTVHRHPDPSLLTTAAANHTASSDGNQASSAQLQSAMPSPTRRQQLAPKPSVIPGHSTSSTAKPSPNMITRRREGASSGSKQSPTQGPPRSVEPSEANEAPPSSRGEQTAAAASSTVFVYAGEMAEEVVNLSDSADLLVAANSQTGALDEATGGQEDTRAVAQPPATQCDARLSAQASSDADHSPDPEPTRGDSMDGGTSTDPPQSETRDPITLEAQQSCPQLEPHSSSRSAADGGGEDAEVLADEAADATHPSTLAGGEADSTVDGEAAGQQELPAPCGNAGEGDAVQEATAFEDISGRLSGALPHEGSSTDGPGLKDAEALAEAGRDNEVVEAHE